MSDFTTWKLILEYDGSRYSGWQEQKNARTVAGEVRKAAEKALNGNCQVDGAGRTDAGVHALAQVARLRTTRKISAEILIERMGNELPKDIAMLHVEKANRNFHPRHDALLRYYLYQISTRRTAFAKPYVWWIRERLNVDAMREACGYLVGRHDFERFSDKRSEEKSTIVVVERAEVGMDGSLILFRIGASHFLWKMVRRVVGVLAEIGQGKLKPEDIGHLLGYPGENPRLRNLSVAALTAPASGLFLERVLYEEEDQPQPLMAAIPVRSVARLLF